MTELTPAHANGNICLSTSPFQKRSFPLTRKLLILVLPNAFDRKT